MRTAFFPARPAGRRAIPALAAALMLCAGMTGAQAGSFPGGGPATFSDPATGYPCVDNWCTVVRLPSTRCICTKDNPGAQRMEDVRLKCSTRENGQWVACPVEPRYGR